MKVVGLLSGGKDSCYNLCHCVKNGHELVALATLGPEPGTDELDSYLYQTVGQDGIHLIAEALQLPLYRRTIQGTPVEIGLEYGNKAHGDLMKGVEGDETEDLYHLLQQVKSLHPDVTGVSVGAILSSYQRIRVEYVCQRLGLSVLAFLWQRDQSELLREMVNAQVNSVLIKVACLGLVPDHLGKNLAEMEPTLDDLHSRYGVHVCGEGGEYETYTIDCPLFHSRIALRKTSVVHHRESSPIAPVAYLRLSSAELVPKSNYAPKLDQVIVPPLLDPESMNALCQIVSQQREDLIPTRKALHTPRRLEPSSSKTSHWTFIASVFDTRISTPPSAIKKSLINEAEGVFNHAKGLLSEHSLTFSDVTHINLYLSSMSDFVEVNNVYGRRFGASPPTRACVASILPGDARVMIDVIARRVDSVDRHQETVGLHVQSLSYWAPANIGPYSQAVMTGAKIFVAGQIGLIPASLTLPSPRSFVDEAVLSLQHVRRILVTFSNPKSIEGIICYMTDMSFVKQARIIWAHTQSLYNKSIPILFLEVSELPKGALVEWQLVAATDQPSSMNKEGDNFIGSNINYFSGQRPAFYGCSSNASLGLTVIGTVAKDSDIATQLPAHHPAYIRGFHSPLVSTDEAERRIKQSFKLSTNDLGDCALSLVCVHSISLGAELNDLDVGFCMMGSLL